MYISDCTICCNTLIFYSYYRTVEVYCGGSFKLLAVIQTHHKLVNVVLWHPYITMASPNASPYKYHVAIASNESYVTVVDLSSLFGKLSAMKHTHMPIITMIQTWFLMRIN